MLLVIISLGFNAWGFETSKRGNFRLRVTLAACGCVGTPCTRSLLERKMIGPQTN